LKSSNAHCNAEPVELVAKRQSKVAQAYERTQQLQRDGVVLLISVKYRRPASSPALRQRQRRALDDRHPAQRSTPHESKALANRALQED